MKAKKTAVVLKEKMSVLKCKNCGGDMIYSPKFRMLYCPYCDSKSEIPHYSVLKRPYEVEKTNGGVQINTTLYKCPNCDAEIELGRFENATVCEYCGAANLIKVDNINGLSPDTILPFLTQKEDALESGKKWIKKKIFAPSVLKKTFSVDNLKGKYVPSFSFDSKTNSSYEARLGNRKTREVIKNGQKQQESYVEWFVVTGKMDEIFEDVMIDASETLSDKEFLKILPFDIENLEKYDYRYVAGYSSERHNKTLTNSYSEAQAWMKGMIEKHILSNYHYDVKDYIHVYTKFNDVKFRYMLLPIWVCAYNFKNKIYKYIVNGRTNKAYGKAPISPLKLIAFIFGILVVVGGLVLLSLHEYGII